MLFMENDQSVTALKTGMEFLKIVSPFYLAVAVKIMTDGLLRGAGSMRAFMVSTFADLILRVILSYILSARFDTLGVWLSWPIGWIIATAIAFFFYKKGVWKRGLV